jgi:hypothetical protein
MKTGLIIGLGVCAAATTIAFAQERHIERMVVRHHGHLAEIGRIDADADGWITRAEALAQADRMFDEIDANDDGRLDGADHRAFLDADGDDAAPQDHVRRVERHEERRVMLIRRSDGDGPDAAPPPAPPAPPHPPMFVMAIGSSEEFDANGDGALSREEFRTQQLRFFDAGDGNGDGRIRFEAPDIPDAPAPPEPPTPPAPPRR